MMPDLRFTGERLAPAGLPPHEQLRTTLQAVRGDVAGDHLVRLGVFYDQTAFADRDALLEAMSAALPPGTRPALSAIPVPTVDGAPTIRAEAVVAADEPERLGDGPFADAVAVGELVFTSAVVAPGTDDVGAQSERVLRRLGEVLSAAGTTLDDTSKLNIFYVGGGTAEDWEVAARVRARAFAEPGPAATGIPVAALGASGALISMEVIALRGAAADRGTRTFSWPDGHWDWPIHLPWKHGNAAAGMAWVGGQVALTPQATVLEPGNLAAQSAIAVENIGRVLDGLGFGFDDIVKLTAFVAGAPDGQRSPVPVDGVPVTHVHLPFLAYEGMVIEIEATAAKAGG